mmetsp:Transcript_77375/g.224491  ORF Transcript_77375/g.224491 Transcript_77375/m.224491 type:complete len:222 (-) Transcript_77375:1149-1814(-)
MRAALGGKRHAMNNTMQASHDRIGTARRNAEPQSAVGPDRTCFGESTRGVPRVKFVSNSVAKLLNKPLTPTNSFFRLSFLSLPKRRKRSHFDSRFHVSRVNDNSWWSSKWATASAADIALVLFFSVKFLIIDVFAASFCVRSASCLSSIVQSRQALKETWTSAPLPSAITVVSIDLPNDFCFAFISAILALVCSVCASTSLSCLLSDTFNLSASKAKAMLP